MSEQSSASREPKEIRITGDWTLEDVDRKLPEAYGDAFQSRILEAVRARLIVGETQELMRTSGCGIYINMSW